MNSVLLSICITSYNRVDELKRCLKSIDTVNFEDVEIIISEDNSPRKKEIFNLINDIKRESKFRIIFNSNERNIGYDRNLEKLISLSNGRYVLFCSDDDAFIPNALDKIYDYLQNNEESFVFTPFINHDGRIMRVRMKSIHYDVGEKSAKKILRDSILFSGLIFRYECLKQYSADAFVNLNYYQVYLALSVTYSCGAFFMNVPLIKEGGDGENGFGTTELSNMNQYLADRKSVFSNLEFNKGLIKVVKIFDQEHSTNVLDAYSWNLSIGTYREMIAAYKQGNDVFEKYWEVLNSLPINVSIISHIYYWMIKYLGISITTIILQLPRRLCLYIRKF